MKSSQTYFVLALFLIVLALTLAILPKTTRNKEIPPDKLLSEINDPARFVTADFVAERLINEDPSIKLVDVRIKEQFLKYSLPGAINVPLNEIITLVRESELNQQDKDIILFSNDDLYANQAWILCTRMGYNNLYVMRGGLNQWYKDILLPKEPKETSSIEEYELYSFRLAASQYFSGASTSAKQEIPSQNINVKKREKKSAVAGGC